MFATDLYRTVMSRSEYDSPSTAQGPCRSLCWMFSPVDESIRSMLLPEWQHDLTASPSGVCFAGERVEPVQRRGQKRDVPLKTPKTHAGYQGYRTLLLTIGWNSTDHALDLIHMTESLPIAASALTIKPCLKSTTNNIITRTKALPQVASFSKLCSSITDYQYQISPSPQRAHHMHSYHIHRIVRFGSCHSSRDRSQFISPASQVCQTLSQTEGTRQKKRLASVAAYSPRSCLSVKKKNRKRPRKRLIYANRQVQKTKTEGRKTLSVIETQPPEEAQSPTRRCERRSPRTVDNESRKRPNCSSRSDFRSLAQTRQSIFVVVVNFCQPRVFGSRKYFS